MSKAFPVLVLLLLAILPPAAFAADNQVLFPQPPNFLLPPQQYQPQAPQAFPGCPEGYVLDEKTGQCFGKPICPPGGEYNPKTKRCESKPLSITCPEGMQYDQGLDRCVSPPVR